MQNIKRIDEAVGSITERRASAKKLLQMVAKGDSSEVEGIKLSKDMAESYLDWLRMSAYGKKFGDFPFGMLFSASFNWGIERYIGKALKTELKELKAKASEMRKAEKFESKSLDEAIDLLKSTWKGTKGWNDIARIMDAGLKKSIKAGSVPVSYAKDYVKSLERMAKRNAKKFFNDYGNFTEDDFIEDVEYNIANESIVTESTINEAFSEWEMSFAPMILSGIKLDPKNVYKVKARTTVEAIKKAAKAAGLSGQDWMATVTNKLEKLK